MIEKRRVRFATIDGIDRLDLPLAAEIWLDDIRKQPWVSPEALKLAVLFARYMASPDPAKLELHRINRDYQLDRREVMQALRLMQIYGFMEAFSLEDQVVRVSLNLSLLHRLHVLEVRERLSVLSAKARPRVPSFSSTPEDAWIPENAEEELELDVEITPANAA